MKQIVTGLALVIVSIFCVQQLASSAAETEACEDCHGAGGVSTNPVVPSLAGISAINTEDALFAFADGLRPETKINDPNGKSFTHEFSEETVTDLGEYFSSLKFVPVTQAFDESKIELGKKVFTLMCESCHSDGGTIVDDEASILAGQHTEYLRLQINRFIDESRADSSGSMREKLSELDDLQVDALLNYLASYKNQK